MKERNLDGKIILARELKISITLKECIGREAKLIAKYYQCVICIGSK